MFAFMMSCKKDMVVEWLLIVSTRFQSFSMSGENTYALKVPLVKQDIIQSKIRPLHLVLVVNS